MPMPISDARKRLAEQMLADAPDVRERLLTLHAIDPARFCAGCGEYYPCRTVRILQGDHHHD